MDRYEMRCTEEQTRKALELGAPIEVCDDLEKETNIFWKDRYFELSNGLLAEYPTTEWMRGWLEDQDDIEEITILRNRAFHSWAYLVINKQDKIVSSNNIYQSRPKATLAAIDAALDYLINKKEE